MKVKYIMFVAMVIATLATVSMVSDDSSAEYEDYIVFGPHNDYDDDYTKFSLKAGYLSIIFDPYNPYYNDIYLIIGGEQYYINHNYVPYDSDDVYFYTPSDHISTIRVNIINTPVDYDVKGEMYSGDHYSTYLGNDSINPTTLSLDAGTYTFKFSRSGYFKPVVDGRNFNFDAGVESTITLEEPGEYYFSHNSYSSYVSNPLPVYYSMSPAPSSDGGHVDVEMTKVTTHTTLKWYKRTIDLSSGTYSCDGSSRMYVFDDPVKAKWFEDNIIYKNVTQPPWYNTGYGNLDWNFTLDTPKTIYVYTIDSSMSINNSIWINSDTYSLGEILVGGESESMYLLANTTSKILVEYDHSKYRMFLYDSASKTLLISGKMLELNNTVSKQYWICIEPIICNSPDCYTAEYMLYTEGIPEPDGNAPLFAALCIGLCVVFFGLLFISGKKPRWKD